MKFLANLNIRKNKASEFYSAYTGRNTLAKGFDLYGGVWPITFNNESVDCYSNDDGVVIYMLTANGGDTKRGIFFSSLESEAAFLEQFGDCDTTARKMIELIRIIKES